jgi:hypothetical protein
MRGINHTFPHETKEYDCLLEPDQGKGGKLSWGESKK